MEIETEPLTRETQTIIIQHNKTQYKVDAQKMSENSLFFRNQINQQKRQCFSINDKHSESAFSAFIKMSTFERTKVKNEDRTELLSIFDEWECPRLKKYFMDLAAENPVLERKETKENVPQQNSPVKPAPGPVLDTPKLEMKTDLPKEDEVSKNCGKIKVHVKCRTGNMYSIEVGTKDTVLRLKKLIMERTGVETERQILYFHSKEMSDDFTIECLGIKNRNKIYLEKRDILDVGDEITIFVCPAGKKNDQVPYFISPKKKVSDLIQLIKNKEKLDGSCPLLVLNEKTLKPDETIESQGVDVAHNVLTLQY